MQNKRAIEDMQQKAAENVENGNEDHFRSYDEGVKDALDWVLENIDNLEID